MCPECAAQLRAQAQALLRRAGRYRRLTNLMIGCLGILFTIFLLVGCFLAAGGLARLASSDKATSTRAVK